MDIFVYIIIGVLSRILPHPANFTAVGGMAVFSGSRLPLTKALIVTFLSMAISDIVIGFHPVMWSTYLGMLGAVIIGRVIARNRRPERIISASLVSSVYFFLLTNMAVFIAPQTMYPKTMAGLIECYVMALPFFRNSLIGDVLFAGIFAYGSEFLGIASVLKRSTVKSTTKIKRLGIRDTMKVR